MSELQAYYARNRAKTQKMQNTLTACTEPAITTADDQSVILKMVDACGIPLRDIRTLDDVWRCFQIDSIGTEDEGETDMLMTHVWKDIQCAAFEAHQTQQSENDQRIKDLEQFMRVERRKVFFRVLGIIGLGICAKYVV